MFHEKIGFYFDLPEELIAQTPLERRDASRLLTLDKTTGAVEHHHFYELPQFLRPNDCLILNDSRVLPARLLGHRSTGGAVEVLLLRDLGDGKWECLTRPGRKTQPGTALSFGDGELTATVVDAIADGNKIVQFHYEGIFLEVLERLGKNAAAAVYQGGAGRIRSATRRSIPVSSAAPPHRRPVCTLRRSSCSRSRTWA